MELYEKECHKIQAQLLRRLFTHRAWVEAQDPFTIALLLIEKREHEIKGDICGK